MRTQVDLDATLAELQRVVRLLKLLQPFEEAHQRYTPGHCRGACGTPKVIFRFPGGEAVACCALYQLHSLYVEQRKYRDIVRRQMERGGPKRGRVTRVVELGLGEWYAKRYPARVRRGGNLRCT